MAGQLHFDDLPVEMFLHIFQFIDLHETVTKLAKVCLLWQDTIALEILAPELYRTAELHPPLKSVMTRSGWTEECKDVGLILSLFNKYECYTSKPYSFLKVCVMTKPQFYHILLISHQAQRSSFPVEPMSTADLTGVEMQLRPKSYWT